METKFSISFLLLMVMATIVLPNHHFMTRVKTSVTLSQLEVTQCEIEKYVAQNADVPVPTFSVLAKTISHKFHTPLPLLNDDDKIAIPTINVLYLAQAPPHFS